MDQKLIAKIPFLNRYFLRHKKQIAPHKPAKVLGVSHYFWWQSNRVIRTGKHT